MNLFVGCGRLTRDPDVRYTQGQDPQCVARFTIAIDRPMKRNNDSNSQTADFISCVAFGKRGEFIEKYCQKGTKLIVQGHIHTGSYTNRDGNKVYTTTVIVDRPEFAESKKAAEGSTQQSQAAPETQGNGDPDGFMDIPDSISEELPFN